ncbi:MAG: hypothetical protein PSV46_06810 [Reyranella sp.]|nr:hypothetical protein [Reyranella sp.]
MSIDPRPRRERHPVDIEHGTDEAGRVPGDADIEKDGTEPRDVGPEDEDRRICPDEERPTKTIP